MKHVFFLLVVILLTACSSEQQQSSALAVANIWGAENFKVETSDKEIIKGENHSVIILTLENLKRVAADYPKNNITSISALHFIQNLAESEYADYDDIKIIVKNNAEQFEKEYKISEIISAKKLLKIVDQFFQKIKNSDFDNLNYFFDTNHVSDSSISKLKQLIYKVDSAEGKPLKMTIAGFDFKTVGAEKKPVLITHTNAGYTKSYIDYTVVLNISDKKIIHFGINEKGVGY